MDTNMQRLHEILVTEFDNFMSDLCNSIKNNENSRVNVLLSIMEDEANNENESIVESRPPLQLKIKNYCKDDSESLLHVAIKYENDIEIIRRIIQLCPDLLLLARGNSKNYEGQTPLHIAITRRHNDLAKLLLTVSNQMTDKMIETCATGLGRLFKNTIMMGELPLSVAALSNDKCIVDLLLKHGAKFHLQNSSKDTLLHSLVKYAAIYPDKTDNVIDMLSFFSERFKHKQFHSDKVSEIREDYYTWFLKNDENLTPLQLSAKLGVVEVFQFIIKIENVYSIASTHDGLFDIKLHDITEIDTFSFHDTSGNICNDTVNVVGVSKRNIKTSRNKFPMAESILEMVFAYNYQSGPAFKIIETIPVKTIIQEKWKKLRFVYYIWALIHYIFTICLTVEAVHRSDLYASISATNMSTLDNFEFKVSNLSYFSFSFAGLFYGLLLIRLAFAKIKRRIALRYIFNNLFYSLFLLILSVSLITDFGMTLSFRYHDNIPLIVAVIMAWSFSVFFLRATHLFGFFTEMIRKVIFGDLFRFSVIISFMLFAFTTGIYASFVGNIESVEDVDAYNEAVSGSFSSYGATMLTLFRLMLGLDDIGVLAQARLPWLATTLYIIFAVLTYVLLMNSLIAMMSQTCSIVCANRYPQWRLQQLSVVLFLEDLVFLACLRKYLRLKCEQKLSSFPISQRETKNPFRFFLKIHSLEETYATEEDREAIQKTEDMHQDIILLETTSLYPANRRQVTTKNKSTECQLTPVTIVHDNSGTSLERQIIQVDIN